MRLPNALPFIVIGVSACASTPPKPPPASAPTPVVEVPPPPPIPAEVFGFGECVSLRVAGEADTRGVPMPKDGGLFVWPAVDCGAVDGWAGVSYAQWGLAGGFSADGKSYLHCGNDATGCQLITVKDAKAKALAPKGNLDDAPSGIFADKAIAPTVKRLKIPGAVGAWPDANLMVSWLVAVTKGSDGTLPTRLTYVLRENTTGTEIELTHFDAPSSTEAAAGGYVIPSAVTLSPDGKTLALRAETQQGQSLQERVILVALTPKLAELYEAAADNDPSHADQWKAKAAALK